MEKNRIYEPSSYEADIRIAEEMAYAEKPHRDFINSPRFNKEAGRVAASFSTLDTALDYMNIHDEVVNKDENLKRTSSLNSLSTLEEDILSDTKQAVYDNEVKDFVLPELNEAEKRDRATKMLAYQAVEAANNASDKVSRRMYREKFTKRPNANKFPYQGGLPTLGKGRK